MKPISPRHAAAFSMLVLATTTSSVMAEDAADASGTDDLQAVIVTAQKTTRSSVLLSGAESQKLLPGISAVEGD